ncbi:MAG: hypothetical protein GOP50_02800 [Candidatus Heimdallarchaeota archaeon]|nr:hypothetical protein [Candidatus Heimdallarchaeota archaeon]
MVSEVIKEELRLTNERLRITIAILLFWVVITTLDITSVINLGEEGTKFVIYAIMATAAILLILCSLIVQAQPLISQMLKNRKNVEQFWETEEKLKPDIEKRRKASEVILIIGILVMLIALLFVAV